MTKDKNTDLLRIKGIRSKGYGIVPKLVMQDRRLSPESKAIYAYFCSFAGSGTTAFPGRGKILHDLNISEKRYYRHFGQLKEYGYIEVEQLTNEKGQFNRNIYTLCEQIPYGQNDSAEPYGHFACRENACRENDGTNINSHKINNSNINNSDSLVMSSLVMSEQLKKKNDNDTDKTMTPPSTENILPPPAEIVNAPIPNPQARKPLHAEKPKYGNKEYSIYQRIIQDNINYKDLIHDKYDVGFIDNLIRIMLDVICTDTPTIKMGGEVKSRDIVRNIYLKLEYDHIQHVIDQFKAQFHQITHKNAYLRKMLYTVYQEMEAYYVNQVRVDGVVRQRY